MKTNASLFLLLLIFIYFKSSGQTSAWFQTGSSFNEEITFTASGPLGSIFIGGVFSQELIAGQDTIQLPGLRNFFFALLDSTGQQLELTVIEHGGLTGQPVAAKWSNTGHWWVAVTFSSYLEINGQTYSSFGGRDGALLRLNGQLLADTAIVVGGSGQEELTALEVDFSGNVWFGGHFSTPLTWGGTTLTSLGGQDVFVGKLNSGLSSLAFRRLGGTSAVSLAGMAWFQQNLALCGSFEQNLISGGYSALSNGGSDAFFLLLDTSASTVSLESFGRNGDDALTGITAGTVSDELFFSGYLTDTVSWRGESLIADQPSWFVAKLNLAGVPTFFRVMEKGSNYLSKPGKGSNGNLTVAFSLTTSAAVAGIPFSSPGREFGTLKVDSLLRPMEIQAGFSSAAITVGSPIFSNESLLMPLNSGQPFSFNSQTFSHSGSQDGYLIGSPSSGALSLQMVSPDTLCPGDTLWLSFQFLGSFPADADTGFCLLTDQTGQTFVLSAQLDTTNGSAFCILPASGLNPGPYVPTLVTADPWVFSIPFSGNVWFYARPTAEILPLADSIFCAGTAIILESPQLLNWWVDGFLSGSSNAVSVEAPAQILGVAHNFCGADTAFLNLSSFPASNLLLNASANHTRLCSGDSVSIFATGLIADSLTLFWNFGQVGVFAADTLFVKNEGTYFLGAFDTNGCRIWSDTLEVTNAEKPGFVYNVPETICKSEGFIIPDATPSGGVFSGPWLTGDTLFLSNSGTGHLVYSFTDSFGCFFTDSLTFEVAAGPDVSLSLPGVFCAGDSLILLTGGSPTGGVYSGPGISGDWFQTSGFLPDKYPVLYSFTDSLGCSGEASDSLHLAANTLVTWQNSGVLCFGCLPMEYLPVAFPIGGTYSGPNCNAEGLVNMDGLPIGFYWFYYSFQNEDGCITMDSIFIKVDICGSVQEQTSNFSLQSYPNPVRGGNFVLKAAEANGPAKLEVFSIFGNKLIAEKIIEFQNGVAQVQSIELYPGVWPVKITLHDGRFAVIKLVVLD